jgi:PEP-CTERM motif
MQTVTRTILSGLVLTALAVATPAFATTMDNFTIDVPGGTVYTFSLPSTPTVSGSGTDYFSVNGVAITITGNGTQSGNTFFDNTVGFGVGGLAIYGLTPSTLDLDYEGPVLFNNSVTNPTFLTGTFTLESDADPGVSADDATVTITATPEPGTLALFGTGLLCLVGAIRRRLSA